MKAMVTQEMLDVIKNTSQGNGRVPAVVYETHKDFEGLDDQLRIPTKEPIKIAIVGDDAEALSIIHRMQEKGEFMDRGIEIGDPPVCKRTILVSPHYPMDLDILGMYQDVRHPLDLLPAVADNPVSPKMKALLMRGGITFKK